MIRIPSEHLAILKDADFGAKIEPKGLERLVAKAIDPRFSESDQKAHKTGLVILAVLLCLVTAGIAGILVGRVKKAFNSYQEKVSNTIHQKIAARILFQKKADLNEKAEHFQKVHNRKVLKEVLKVWSELASASKAEKEEAKKEEAEKGVIVNVLHAVSTVAGDEASNAVVTALRGVAAQAGTLVYNELKDRVLTALSSSLSAAVGVPPGAIGMIVSVLKGIASGNLKEVPVDTANATTAAPVTPPPEGGAAAAPRAEEPASALGIAAAIALEGARRLLRGDYVGFVSGSVHVAKTYGPGLAAAAINAAIGGGTPQPVAASGVLAITDAAADPRGSGSPQSTASEGNPTEGAGTH